MSKRTPYRDTIAAFMDGADRDDLESVYADEIDADDVGLIAVTTNMERGGELVRFQVGAEDDGQVRVKLTYRRLDDAADLESHTVDRDAKILIWDRPEELADAG